MGRGVYLGRAKEPGQQAEAPHQLRDRNPGFDDPLHVSTQDREVDGESRWQTIGMANDLHILLVAHTVDEAGDMVRIFSARKATRMERSIYAQGS